MNEENNEEVVENDVPKTSEENLEEVNIDTSEDVEQNQEEVQETETNSEEDIEAKIEERANALMEEKIKDRLARDRASQERKYNKELSKYKQLENIMKAGLEVENLDDAIIKSSEFYREQGVNIPEFKDEYSEKREERLAKLDAQDIIDLGLEETKAEANRLANIQQRSTYEETVFNTLCENLVEQKQVTELKEKGIDVSILEDKSFKAFKDKFAVNTAISDIYEMYSKLNQKPVEKPASAGSAKSENSDIGETFSAERINNMTSEEMMKYWENPAFRKSAGLN